jgi:hypothetical protein
MANLPITPGSGASARTVELAPDIHAQMVFQAEMHPVALDLAAIGDHVATVDNTVDQLPNIPSDATHALLSVETAELRWLDTGTNPTATQGHKLVADTYFWISGRQRLLDWRMIRVGGTSATIFVTYYKYSDTA